MWDQIGEYDKIRRTTRKRRKAEASESSDTESEDGTVPGEIRTGDNASANLNPTVSDSSELLFLPKHPQSTTHALRKRKIRHIPVLCGWPIPRRDLEDQAEMYAVSILTLFRPWNRSVDATLKPDDVSWSDALALLLSTLPPHHLKVINHMQEQWECKLAADDFSAQRRK
ncbi:hypothetical protein C8J57DRAFT_1074979, partial [Mycena rebaudengoi]